MFVRLNYAILLTFENCYFQYSFSPLKMSGLNSIAFEIAIYKLLFLGRLFTEPNMAPAACQKLLESRAESYVDTNIASIGIMLSISEVLVKYDLFQYFESWFNNSAFPTHTDWKRVVRDRIQVFERDFTYDLSFATLIQTCMLLRLVSKICLSNDFGL